MGKVYFLRVGCGDATLIKTDTATFLIDCYNIGKYKIYLPENKIIRGMFITHQHEDHYSGLNFLKDYSYRIEFLICSPYERRHGDNSVTVDEWTEFESLKDYFVSKGTKVYSQYRQDDFNRPFWNTDGLQFCIIGPDKANATSSTRELHDASLVIEVSLGDRKICFAGDASGSTLHYIAHTTNNYCDDILHASHHGSINGANLDFIIKANIEYTIISTESGVHDNVPHPTALSRYHKHSNNSVLRTDTNGTQILDF